MPTFSQATITFITDFEIADVFLIASSIMEDGYEAEFVATRSASNEVTTGTPTGTPGETTAINYKTAFDLDNTGYVTIQTGNEVVIQSETEEEYFTGIKLGENNVGTLSVEYDKYTPPTDVSNVDKALTRSPYYVNMPFLFEETTKATVDIRVWSGDYDTPPTEPSYTVSKVRPTIDYGEFNIDLSKIVEESLNPVPIIDLTLTPKLIDSNCAKWVSYVASYTDLTNSIADVTGSLGVLSGYGYYLEGVNPTTPTNKILTNCFNRKVSRDGFIILPFINDGTYATINIATNSGEINTNLTPVSSTESNSLVQYVVVDLNQVEVDTQLTVTLGTNKVIYDIIDECRFTPTQVLFKNKYGVFDCLTMFRKREDSIDVENSTFVNNYISNGVYDKTIHQYKDSNIQGRESASLNSGYISEGENKLYQELLLSAKGYFYESGVVPVNVETKNLPFKNRENDRLVKYNVDFKYSFNLIQNV